MPASLLLLVSTFVAQPNTPPERPPKLDFANPPDYVAWFNKYVTHGKYDNAYPVYRPAMFPDDKAEGGIPAPSAETQRQMEEAIGKIWDPEKNRDLNAYLFQCSKQIQALKMGVRKPDFWQNAPTDLPNLDVLTIPYLGPSRLMTNIMLIKATRQRNKQAKEMVRDCGFALRFANHIRQGPFLVSGMTARKERELIFQLLLSLLQRQALAGEQALKIAIDNLDLAGDITGDFKAGVDMECGVLFDLLKYLCPGGKVDPMRWQAFVKHMMEMNRPDLAQFRAPDTFDPKPAVEILEAAYQARCAVLANPMTRSTMEEFRRVDDSIREKYQAHPYTVLVTASLTHAYEKYLLDEVFRRGLLLAVSLHYYQIQWGKWPQKLDEMALESLAKVKIDPCSGKDFVYRVEGGRPKLYSVGTDGKDDGGRFDPKTGPIGTDFVFLY